MTTDSRQKQVNIRMHPSLYRTLATIARQEHRTIPQAARLLLEEGLQRRVNGRSVEDDTQGADIVLLALAGNAFQWLEEEPDLYDDTCGEPV